MGPRLVERGKFDSPASVIAGIVASMGPRLVERGKSYLRRGV